MRVSCWIRRSLTRDPYQSHLNKCAPLEAFYTCLTIALFTGRRLYE